jgi:hypothetical protein
MDQYMTQKLGASGDREAHIANGEIDKNEFEEKRKALK